MVAARAFYALGMPPKASIDFHSSHQERRMTDETRRLGVSVSDDVEQKMGAESRLSWAMISTLFLFLVHRQSSIGNPAVSFPHTVVDVTSTGPEPSDLWDEQQNPRTGLAFGLRHAPFASRSTNAKHVRRRKGSEDQNHCLSRGICCLKT